MTSNADLIRLARIKATHPCSLTRETDTELLIAELDEAVALLIQIHETLGYLPTWTRTAGEIADWHRRATEYLGDRRVLDPVQRRILGKT